MALSKYQSTQETANFARIARIIQGPCSDVLRDVLRKEIPPFNFQRILNSYLLKNTSRKKSPLNISISQRRLLLSSSDYSDFDISLLYALLRNLCQIPPHANRWGNVPYPADRSLSANIERIRLLRNESFKISKFSLSNSEFEKMWRNILSVVQELENYIGSSNIYQETLMELTMCSMDPNVEESLILKYQGVDNLQSEITKLEGRKLYFDI